MSRTRKTRIGSAAHAGVCYELLRPAQVIKRRRAAPLAYLPLGVIEWHGQHNPLGLDGLKVHGLCVRAAALAGGLVFPVLWYGENRRSHLAEVNPSVRGPVARAMGLKAPGPASDTAGGGTALDDVVFYQNLLWRILEQIRQLGFRAIVVLYGHNPLKLPAQTTAQIFERVAGTPILAAQSTDFVPGYVEDHAARFETGVMMALRPELVNLRTIAGIPKSKLVGIGGADPRRGSQKLGREFVPACVEKLAAAGQELLRRKASTGAMRVT